MGFGGVGFGGMGFGGMGFGLKISFLIPKVATRPPPFPAPLSPLSAFRSRSRLRFLEFVKI